MPPPDFPPPVRDAPPEEGATQPTAAPAADVDLAHCCPYCGRPVAVMNLLVPVEEPPAEHD